MQNDNRYGRESLSKLLREQAIPAAVGMLVMSVYGIVDTIFVGRFVGELGIGAITVVMPITFLISSIGMAIGVGGSSIISRAFGAKDHQKATNTFGNQLMLTLSLSVFFVLVGFVFADEILLLFGGKGELLEPSKTYFIIVLYSVPALAWAMMSNSVIRAEGHPKIAMFTLLIPAIVNLILDPIFIAFLDWGLEGAAWATMISYLASAIFTASFFIWGPSTLKLNWKGLKFYSEIVKEIGSLGSVTLARQGTISVLAIVLNNSLFTYGGETGIAVYGIVSKLLMFANFPVLGITQGFVPIVGYNYGAELFERVSSVTRIAVKSATFIAVGLFLAILIFANELAYIFTSDPVLVKQTASAIRQVFLATPLLAINMIGGAFFQAIGKAKKALLLAVSKQGLFLIPLILILPLAIGIEGIWYSFPLADLGAAALSYYMLKRQKVKLF